MPADSAGAVRRNDWDFGLSPLQRRIENTLIAAAAERGVLVVAQATKSGTSASTVSVGG
jgi:hypothetical protein